jgi:hypothetical protein
LLAAIAHPRSQLAQVQTASSACLRTRQGQMRGGRLKPSGGSPEGGCRSGSIKTAADASLVIESPETCTSASIVIPPRAIISHATPHA